MEVDPAAGLPLSGDLELPSRPSYAHVAAGRGPWAEPAAFGSRARAGRDRGGARR